MTHPVDNDLDELEEYLKNQILMSDRFLRAVRSMRSHNNALQTMIVDQEESANQQPDDSFEKEFYKTVEGLIKRKG